MQIFKTLNFIWEMLFKIVIKFLCCNDVVIKFNLNFILTKLNWFSLFVFEVQKLNQKFLNFFKKLILYRCNIEKLN